MSTSNNKGHTHTDITIVSSVEISQCESKDITTVLSVEISQHESKDINNFNAVDNS